MKIPIISTGTSGLVGTRIKELLSEDYEFEDMSLATGIDIRNSDQVDETINEKNGKVILHMAAKTDVDGCEDDKILGEDGDAWRVNVIGTENIVKSAEKFNKKIIYISTDFIFDGTKDFYSENDEPNPVSWYGYTKFIGEETVLNSRVKSTVLRISYPYKSHCLEKKDFVHRIIDLLKRDKKIYGLTDHIFTPTFIDDISMAMKIFLERDLSGIYHVVGEQSLRAIEAAEKIKDVFSLTGEILPVTREEFFKNRAFRPFKLALKNDKISKLGIRMSSFDKGLALLKKQES